MLGLVLMSVWARERWGAYNPIHGGYTTSMAMFGSGCKIAGTKIMRALLLSLKFTQVATVLFVCSVVVAGTLLLAAWGPQLGGVTKLILKM